PLSPPGGPGRSWGIREGILTGGRERVKGALERPPPHACTHRKHHCRYYPEIVRVDIQSARPARIGHECHSETFETSWSDDGVDIHERSGLKCRHETHWRPRQSG